MEILPTEGEILLVTSDGKAKRLDQKQFPIQGRYGKGVIAWDLSDKVKLAGVVVDKSTHMATIHLTKGAPKSTRLDTVTIRKRAATKGDVIVEVKPGEEVVSVNVNWTVEKYVEEQKESGKRKSSPKGKDVNGKKPVQARASSNGQGKTSSPKGKSAPKKSVTKSKTPRKKSKK